ncbi:MAG TPA: VC0807 family protein [Acidobacteriaceae bacterium]|nr:VC0807 family protein [Acidobacteriaceae bacterium]
MALARKIFVNSGIEILVNFVLPYVIYVQTEAKIGAAHALMAASLPPILWSVVEFARKRRIDALSLLVIAGIVLSLLAFAGGGSVRFLQLRENLVTGLIGLVFLGSAAIGRPLIYQLARASKLRESRSEADKFEELRKFQSFRRGMTVMTLVWGFGLVAQTLLACLLVFHMTIRNYLIASPFLGYGTMGVLALWTFLYVRRMKRRGAAARRAAEAKDSIHSVSTG